MNPPIMGYVQGFSRVTQPATDWRAGRGTPVGATGWKGPTSLLNLTKPYAIPGGTYTPQNLQARVPASWATNPLGGQRPATFAGNGFHGSSAI